MDNIGYLALSRASQLERATAVTSNNVANANTNGFKAANTVFENLVVDTGSKDTMSKMSYSIDRGTYTDLTEGGLLQTSNPLDVALAGDGWFGFMTPEGQTALGRNGSFTLNGAGDLMTVSGDYVLDEGGAPINIPPGSGSVSIAKDGTITDEAGAEIARLGVFEAEDISSWTHHAGQLIAPADGEPGLVPALNPNVAQGFVEQSNVNSIAEMSKMISLQRQYEAAINLATTADDLRKTTLSSLAPE
jgi:flagellar basal-body rod protein FlgF